MLVRFIEGSTILNLTPVVLGEFNEALIHIDANTDLVRFSWNGAELYNAVTAADAYNSADGYAEFGASTYWGQGATSTVTFDWVGYGPAYVPEPSSVVLALAGLVMLPLLRCKLRR